MNKKLYLSWLDKQMPENKEKIEETKKVNESRSHVRFLQSIIATLLKDRDDTKSNEQSRRRAEEPVNVEGQSNIKDFSNLIAPTQSIKTTPSPPAWSYNIRNALGLSNAIGGNVSRGGGSPVYEETIEEGSGSTSKVVAKTAGKIGRLTRAAGAGQKVVKFKPRPGTGRKGGHGTQRAKVVTKKPEPKKETGIVPVKKDNLPVLYKKPEEKAIVPVKKDNLPVLYTGNNRTTQSQPITTAPTTKLPVLRKPGSERGSFQGSDLEGLGKGSSGEISKFTRSIKTNPRTSFGSAGAVSVGRSGGLVTGQGSGGGVGSYDPSQDEEEQLQMSEQKTNKPVVYKPTVGTFKKTKVVHGGTPQSTAGHAAQDVSRNRLPLGENTLKTLVSSHVDKFLKSRHGQKLKHEAASILKGNTN